MKRYTTVRTWVTGRRLRLGLPPMPQQTDLPYRVNDLPYGRSAKGHPVVVNFFYHEKIRLSNR